MAKAVRSLSPKQIQERIQQHRQAVMMLARRSARKAIEARLKGQGVRVSQVPPSEINALTNDYLAEHRAFFVIEAKQAIATRPASTDGGSMKRIRNLLSQPGAIWWGKLEQDIAELVFELFHKSEHSPNASNVISGKTTNERDNANNSKPNTTATTGELGLSTTGVSDRDRSRKAHRGRTQAGTKRCTRRSGDPDCLQARTTSPRTLLTTLGSG